MNRKNADPKGGPAHKAKKRGRKEDSKRDTFVADSNKCIKFHIVNSNKNLADEVNGVGMRNNNAGLVPFSPLFTHQVFSSSEKIHGYNGLKIDMYLTCATLKCYLRLRYNKKSKNSDSITFSEFGENITTDPKKFQNWVTYDLEKFKPCGKKVYEFDRICDKHRHYEVYKICLSDKNFTEAMNKSLQAMFLFNIESASYIDKDSSWNYFLLYEVVKKFKNNPTSYRLIGYSTTYETLKGRRAYNRISQFLILPCYQKQSFGKSLVQSIYDYYMKDASCEEISVEKPTNAFKRLRDSIEYNLVIKNGYFKSIDNIVLEPTTKPEQELYEVVLEIHQKLKISNSRIIKILESHYLTKKDLVYKHSSSSKNAYEEFKKVINAVQKMISAQRGSRISPIYSAKISPKNLRTRSKGRQGMKNPRKRQRKQTKLETKAKLRHFKNSNKNLTPMNARDTTFSSSSMVESAPSDSDSEWRSPIEETKSEEPKVIVKNKLRSHQLETKITRKSDQNCTTRTTKRRKLVEHNGDSKRVSARTRAGRYSKLDKVVVTEVKI